MTTTTKTSLTKLYRIRTVTTGNDEYRMTTLQLGSSPNGTYFHSDSMQLHWQTSLKADAGSGHTTNDGLPYAGKVEMYLSDSAQFCAIQKATKLGHELSPQSFGYMANDEYTPIIVGLRAMGYREATIDEYDRTQILNIA